MRHLRSTLAVLGAASLLFLAGNTVSVAATGNGFILGKSNSASNVTGLTRTTSGPALRLRTRTNSGSPLAVNGSGRVANLNADFVDGMDSSQMVDRVHLWTRNITSALDDVFELVLANLPPGTYEVGYSVRPQFASVPAGTSVTCALVVQEEPAGDIRTVAENRSSAPAVNVGPAVSGSAVITFNVFQKVLLRCSGSAAFGTYSDQPIQVYASPTAVVAQSNF